MAIPLAKEVEQLAFRPNIGERAQYYAVTFLTKFIFNVGEEIASVLTRIYLDLFKVLSKQDEKMNPKLLSVILTGLNRAFPYVNTEDTIYDDQIKTLFKMIHQKKLCYECASTFITSSGNFDPKEKHETILSSFIQQIIIY